MSKGPKAILSNGARRRVDSGQAQPMLAGQGDTRRILRPASTGNALPARTARMLIGAVALTVTLAFAVYAVLAVTVLVVMRADGHNAVVLRGAFPIGQAPAGAYAYVSSDPVSFSLLDKTEQALSGVPAGSVVQIVAGPVGDVTTDPEGFIVADGQRTTYRAAVDTQQLHRQYVAMCIVGACEPGTAVLVGQDNIVGQVQGYLTPSGLTDLPANAPN